MAPTSKSRKGAAPAASASKSVVQPRKTQKELKEEKRLANKKRYREQQASIFKELREEKDSVGQHNLVVQGALPRPTKYTAKLGELICLMFASDPNMSLLKLNRDPQLPTVWTFYEWLRDHPELEKAYARSRELHADMQAAELEEWSDTPLLGVKKIRRTKSSETNGDEVSEEVQEFDNIERARLKVETRKWMLARMQPKKYGIAPVEPGSDDALQDLLAQFRARSSEITDAS